MRIFLIFCLSFSLLTHAINPTTPQHALAPLSENELGRAITILKENKLLGNGYYLQLLRLVEPPKEKVLFGGKHLIPRHAFAIVMHTEKNENYEVVIDLAKGIRSKTRIARGQPAILMSEYPRISDTLLRDQRVIEALNKRGITDPKQIYIDTWAPGELEESKANQKNRIMRNVFYYRGDAINPYARPVGGLSAIFDVTKNVVVEVIDSGVVKMAPSAEDFFDNEWIRTVSHGILQEGATLPSSIFTLSSSALNRGPIASQQKMDPRVKAEDDKLGRDGYNTGSSFRVNGNEIRWQGFHFVAHLHQREGLVIGQVGFEEQGRFRSILYRGSMSEMVVPYGDPDKQWYWRCAFDQGDYGVGNLTNSLEPGAQIPADSHTISATFADDDGKISTIPNAVAIFEREGNLLWSHYDERTEKIAARLGRELVVMSIFTIGNYDYATQWIFRQDATIEVKVTLTGVLASKAVDMTKCGRCETLSKKRQLSAGDQYGAIIAPNLVGTIHQHFFNFRLDFAIEGSKNSVAEIKFVPAKDSTENPKGNVFSYEEEILKTELTAAQKVNPSEGRHWWIFNPNRRNSLGHFSGYLLEPLGNTIPYAQAHAQVLKRATFLQNHFWVTTFHPSEMNAAGSYPNQNLGDGLTEWTKRNAPIVNKDIVVWYSCGVTHLPRAEDWPVMAAASTGFLLKPKGFFERNPALNVVSTARNFNIAKR